MDPRYKQFLMRKLVKDITYNPMSMHMEIGEVNLSNWQERESVKREGKLYGYTAREVDEHINSIINEGIQLESKIEEVRIFDPILANIGQHLIIKHGSNGKINTEELLKIDSQSYLLVDHDRGALLPGNLLHVKNTPWSVGGTIRLDIEQDGKIYETTLVKSILLLGPPEIIQHIDPTQNIHVERRLYASHPNISDGFDYKSLSIHQQQDSLFVIEQENEKAIFHPIQGITYSEDAVKHAIEPACEILSPFSKECTNLKIIKNGELTLIDNCWIVISKAQVKFF